METTRLLRNTGARPEEQIAEGSGVVASATANTNEPPIALTSSSLHQEPSSRENTYNVTDQLARMSSPRFQDAIESCHDEDRIPFRLTMEHFMVLNADYYRPTSTALTDKIWPPLAMINDRIITFVIGTASRPLHIHLSVLEPLTALYYLFSEVSPCMPTHTLPPTTCPIALLALFQVLYHTQKDDPYPNSLTTHNFKPINFLDAIPLAVQFSASPEIYPRLRLHMAYAFHIMLTPAMRRRELFGSPPLLHTAENDTTDQQNNSARFYPTQDPYSLLADNTVLERMARYTEDGGREDEQKDDCGMRWIRRDEFLAVQACLRRSRSIFPLKLRPFTVGAYAHLARVMGMRVVAEIGREEVDSELLFEIAMLMEGVKGIPDCCREGLMSPDRGGEGPVSLELDLWQYPVEDLVLAYPGVWARLQDCIMKLDGNDQGGEEKVERRMRVDKGKGKAKGKSKVTMPSLEEKEEEDDQVVVEEAMIDVMTKGANGETSKEKVGPGFTNCPMH